MLGFDILSDLLMVVNLPERVNNYGTEFQTKGFLMGRVLLSLVFEPVNCGFK